MDCFFPCGLSQSKLNEYFPIISEFPQILQLENWLIKEAQRVEKTALEQALLKQQHEQHLQQLRITVEQNCGRRGVRKMKIEKMENMPEDGGNNEHFLTRCGIAWKFLANVRKDEFDKLRRTHQVSKNRHVGYGVRYACTRNAKARDNCPYLMLCMPNADGTLRAYYRNTHTHPIRQIRAREVPTATTNPK